MSLGMVKDWWIRIENNMTIKDLQEKITKFRDERDWKQFHTPKDASIALIIEAGEVLDHFKWKTNKETEEHLRNHKDKVGDELSDVLYWTL